MRGGELRLAGKADVLWNPAVTIMKEVRDADEDESRASEIFDELLP